MSWEKNNNNIKLDYYLIMIITNLFITKTVNDNIVKVV